MSASTHPPAPLRVALVGVPNSGKTALFNRLTGSRQKVANYAGVTVERKEGSFVGRTHGRRFDVTDLPGAYSLTPTTLDEAITRDQLLGRLAGELPHASFVICVVDATNLRLNLRLVLDLKTARAADGRRAEHERSRREARLPARRRTARRGTRRARRDPRLPSGPTVKRSSSLTSSVCRRSRPPGAARAEWRAPDATEIEATQRRVREILNAAGYVEPLRHRALERIDAIVMHPILGHR